MKKEDYINFLKASYEHLLGMSEKINNPEYMDKSLIDRDRLEVLIIDTMMRVRKELGFKEEENEQSNIVG